MMKKLKNNNDLVDYLVCLSGELKAQNQIALADEVILTSQFVIGSSTEFLHEAETVLLKVLNVNPSPLTIEQLQDSRSIILQIQEAFRNVGGA